MNLIDQRVDWFSTNSPMYQHPASIADELLYQVGRVS
tara:strand:+ start:3621 stop:3731 length:111 start_codon:yes stop_codon:yes gene_type:complete